MSLRSLGKQSLTYGVGHILSRLVTFLLLPLYTNVFTQEQYGVISLAYAFMGFALIVYRYGMDSALMKYYVQAEGQESAAYISTVFSIQLMTALTFSGIIYFLRDFLATIVLSVHDAGLMAMVAGILFFDCLWNIPTLILRAEEKPGRFVAINLANVVLTLGLNYYLVVVRDLGVTGVLLGNLIASATMLFLTLPIVFNRFTFAAIDKPVVRKVLKFGLPFLPAGIFTMIMELADRYLLEWLADTATVGLYSAGYKLGMFGLLLVMGFNMGWTPYFLRRGKDSDAPAEFSRITTYFLGICGFVMIIISIWIDKLIQIQIGSFSLIGSEFWGASAIVPAILLGYYFFGVYVLNLPGVFLSEKTGWVPVFRGVGAGANIILNIILIPKFGAIGAAWATALAHFSMAALIIVMANRLYPIPKRWPGIIFPVIYFAGISVLPDSTSINLGATLLFPMLWFLLVADQKDRAALFGSKS